MPAKQRREKREERENSGGEKGNNGKEKGKKRKSNNNNNNNTQEEAADREVLHSITATDDTWWSMIIKLICLFVSLFLVISSPLPPNDVHKPANNTSFLSLYFSGGLDTIHHITQMLLASFFSLFLDIGVVSYHLSTPPHPKFVMIPSRKFSIYLHLISGILEISSGVVAFVIRDPVLQTYSAFAMSIFSITHAFTAYYQTGIVFGAKGLMVPGYIYAITLHVVNAYRLFYNPGSVIHLLYTFLMLHIYVWCRFFIYFFRVCGMFTGYHYTVSIAFSGLLLFPYSMGPIGNYGMLLVCLVYCTLHWLVSKSTAILCDTLFVEHERYAIVTKDMMELWKNSLVTTQDADADKKLAKEVFDRFDLNKTGTIGLFELQQMVSTLGIQQTTKRLLEVADINKDNAISFDEFYRYIWNMASIKTRLRTMPKAMSGELSDKEKARLVFEMLDLDGSNFIGLVELELLLCQWGMPASEAEYYLAKYVGGKKKITFEIFFDQLKPIWTFGSQFVFE